MSVEPNAPVTVVIVDDYPLFREAVAAQINLEPDLAVVGEAGGGDLAVDCVAVARPDVVLLDTRIPGEDALVTLSRILAVSPRSQVLLIGPNDDAHLIRRALMLGARGFLRLNAQLPELLATVREAVRDPDRVTLSISRAALCELRAPLNVELSQREQSILLLVAQAKRNSQIAAQLQIAEDTVKRHLHKIFKKLSAESRMDAVNKAVAASLITLVSYGTPVMERSLPDEAVHPPVSGIVQEARREEVPEA
jgi:DNA-binding NarL/FixJ family response regulator